MALATDYDATLASHGVVPAAAIDALKQVRDSGRKLILVTGRELPDLERAFPQLELFDLVVAENGALLYDPATKKEELLASPPPVALVQRLHVLDISPLSIGRSIVATYEPHETAVLSAIRELGLELQIIFNKGAVMVLPSNVNKATGLKAALDRLALSPHNVVGIGDAENDHAFLLACGCAVAVANALPSLKAKADLITEASEGAGVVELIGKLVSTDLAGLGVALPRARPILGYTSDGRAVSLEPMNGSVLIAGASGSGKSTIVNAMLERMRGARFQFCVIDPEGDHAEFDGGVVVGGAKQEPSIGKVVELLERQDTNAIVNLLDIDAPDRPRFFAKLLPEIARLRGEWGRPHWIVVDEAHHMLPAHRQSAPLIAPRELPPTILVTLEPDAITPAFLASVTTVVAVGDKAGSIIGTFCKAAGAPPPRELADRPTEREAYVWRRGDAAPTLVSITKPKAEHRRHARKYAEGDLGRDRSFVFTGPQAALKLRAQNLMIFLQMAEGVDDATWLHHLHAGDYSRWFTMAIKDQELAAEARSVEQSTSLSAAESRERIKAMVNRRYTAPAKAAR